MRWVGDQLYKVGEPPKALWQGCHLKKSFAMTFYKHM